MATVRWTHQCRLGWVSRGLLSTGTPFSRYLVDLVLRSGVVTTRCTNVISGNKMGKMLLGGFALSLGLGGLMGGSEGTSSTPNPAAMIQMQKQAAQRQRSMILTLDEMSDAEMRQAQDGLAAKNTRKGNPGLGGGLGTNSN